jgi:hypothetical protein
MPVTRAVMVYDTHRGILEGLRELSRQAGRESAGPACLACTKNPPARQSFQPLLADAGIGGSRTPHRRRSPLQGLERKKDTTVPELARCHHTGHEHPLSRSPREEPLTPSPWSPSAMIIVGADPAWIAARVFSTPLLLLSTPRPSPSTSLGPDLDRKSGPRVWTASLDLCLAHLFPHANPICPPLCAPDLFGLGVEKRCSGCRLWRPRSALGAFGETCAHARGGPPPTSSSLLEGQDRHAWHLQARRENVPGAVVALSRLYHTVRSSCSCRCQSYTHAS